MPSMLAPVSIRPRLLPLRRSLPASGEMCLRDSIDGQYAINPTVLQVKSSELDLVVAGTENAVLMVESEADELPEDQMLGAVLFAHQEFQAVIQAVKEFAAEAGKPTWNWQAPAANTPLLDAIRSQFGEAISQAYTITIKQDRYNRLDELREQVIAALAGEGEGKFAADEVKAAFGELSLIHI